MAVFSTPSQLDARKIATKPKPVSTAVELQLQAEHVLHLQRILAACVSDSGSDGLNALSARHQQSHSHPRGQLLPHPSSKHETVAIPSKASSSGSIHSKQIRSPPPPSPKSSFNLGHSILPVKRYAHSIIEQLEKNDVLICVGCFISDLPYFAVADSDLLLRISRKLQLARARARSFHKSYSNTASQWGGFAT